MIHHISPNWAYNGPTGGPTLGLHIKLKNDLLNYKKVRNVKSQPGNLPVLSRVNMEKVMSGRQDLNLRPLDPQPSALPDCATPRIMN